MSKLGKHLKGKYESVYSSGAMGPQGLSAEGGLSVYLIWQSLEILISPGKRVVLEYSGHTPGPLKIIFQRASTSHNQIFSFQNVFTIPTVH